MCFCAIKNKNSLFARIFSLKGFVEMSPGAAPSRMTAARSHKYTEWKQYMPTDFPIGVRALLVDDNRVCLAIMKQMLTKAQYEVTACHKATEALSLLRKKKESFDIIISDVHMSGMDGFELLQLASLEIDHPFILISVDASLNVMMRGYSLGATDYLIKPLRIEDLGHVWKHIAKTRLSDKEAPKCIRHNTLAIEEPKSSSNSMKRKAAAKLNDDDDDDNSGDESKKDDSSSSKRTHLMWTLELHQRFLSAVNQIGVDKAVPKQILELMNVPGITRDNVASHLQKYRMRLRKFGQPKQSEFLRLCSGVAARTGQSESYNFPAMCSPYQMPAQTLASLEQGILGRPSGSVSVPPMGHLNLQHASMQSQPLMDCQTNMWNRSPHWKVAGSNNSSHRAIQAVNIPVSSNRNFWYNNGSTSFDHQLLSIGRRMDENFSNVGVFNGSRIPGSTSSSVSACEV